MKLAHTNVMTRSQKKLNRGKKRTALSALSLKGVEESANGGI
jgi:hypothetical protein